MTTKQEPPRTPAAAPSNPLADNTSNVNSNAGSLFGSIAAPAVQPAPPPPAAARVPPAEVALDSINIKVSDGAGGEVFFKIKKTTRLGKLMDSYIQRLGVQVGAVKFLYDGRRIDPDSTPTSLEMEEGDTIDAMIAQTGGH